ncbi:U32 family peptidase (plasmid) [Rhizobium jaguaris]|uniref:Ubiquinone biosynthesis protein UbiV n=2 Tax=Rhizobium jaguaris TaxID=1312183 RepID=A0A387G7L7_9HYPH|nr:U32 family peptidase [Rhizobium jaguaris]AYG63881.1 U32 family peptidase [Rhizobium jaguaris]
MPNAAIGLTLGPVPYLWEEERWRDFYFRIADEAPLDVVVLGETVCSKRLHFTEAAIGEVIERLEASGKLVQLSTLALVTLERELQYQKEVASSTSHMVEANDLSALHLLRGRPHAVGPLVNVYNASTAKFLAKNGATTICLPPELPATSVQVITRECRDIQYELFAFGRLPLAMSARCAHARSKGKIKDNCQFVCGQDPDGLVVSTLAKKPFLTLNGVQTMSFTCQAILPDRDQLAALGVNSLRLSPQTCDMVSVARLFRSLISGQIGGDEAAEALRRIYPDVPLSNGFHHQQAGAAWIGRNRNAEMGSAQ